MKRDNSSAIESYLQNGGVVKHIPQGKRAYTPSEMFCIMRGIDPNEECNIDWAKKFTKKTHLRNTRH